MFQRAFAILPILVFLLGCSTEKVVTPVVKCAKVVDIEYVERPGPLYVLPSYIEVYLVLSDGSRQRYVGDGFDSDVGYAKAYPVQFKHGHLGTEMCRTEFVKK